MENHREGGSIAAQRVMADDVRVLASVLRRLLRGEVPSPTRIGLGTGLTPLEVEAALTRLHTAGAVYMADGMVRAAYPLSGVPTRHRLSIGRATAHANCAIDALAVPLMVDEPVSIDSTCAACGVAVTVQMLHERILAVQPEAPVVVYLVPGDCCEAGPAVLTRCPYINFFCGHDHAAQWQRDHAERPGTVLSLAETAAWARERFASVVRLVRGGDVPPADLVRHGQRLTLWRE